MKTQQILFPKWSIFMEAQRNFLQYGLFSQKQSENFFKAVCFHKNTARVSSQSSFLERENPIERRSSAVERPKMPDSPPVRARGVFLGRTGAEDSAPREICSIATRTRLGATIRWIGLIGSWANDGVALARSFEAAARIVISRRRELVSRAT